MPAMSDRVHIYAARTRWTGSAGPGRESDEIAVEPEIAFVPPAA